MRVVALVIAALATLGLAAFGVVAAQKANAPAAPAVQAAAPAPSTPVPPRAPVTQIAQAQPAQMSDATAVAPTRPAAAPAPAAAPPPAAATPTVVAQNTPAPKPTLAEATPAAAPAVAPPPPPAPAAPPATAIPACDKPGGMGLARIVEIDTTGGPGFGFEHFKQIDFLRDKEVVLTFDDGPWPVNTAAILKALADNCLKATFFEIGEHAIWHPEITKMVLEAGNTVGTHTWSHKNLEKKPFDTDLDAAKTEIEMGVSAVHLAAGGAPIAPFFRFPDLKHPPALLAYLAERNIGIFSTDIDSFDFKIHQPPQVIQSVLTRLKKYGKGIVLMHDFQKGTAEAMPELLRQLKANGYRIVHMVPKAPVVSLAKYDEMVMQQDKLSANNAHTSASSVVRTIGE